MPKPAKTSADDTSLSGSEPEPVLREEFVKMLLCPESRQPLALADASAVSALNKAISTGQVKNVAGEPIVESVDAALIREDGQVFYTVIGRIPRLTKEEGVAASQFLGTS